jgi:hypothetical protein
MRGIGCTDVLLYFKYPVTKQMRCPVNAYKKSTRSWGDGCASEFSWMENDHTLFIILRDAVFRSLDARGGILSGENSRRFF